MSDLNSIMESPFKAISVLYRRSHIWLNSSCLPHGLTAAQAGVILIVCDFETLTQDEITKRLSLDKSVVAKTVTKLAAAGFLVRTTNAKDKRTYDVAPTQRARQVYPLLKEEIDAGFRRMTQRMTEAERREFQRLLLLAAQTALEQEG